MGGLVYGGRSLPVKQILRSYGMLFLIAGIVVLVDQLSKAYIRANFVEQMDMWAPWPWMIQYARIIHVSNSGVAFGLFKGLGGIFTVLAIVVAIAIVYYFPRVPSEDWPLRLAMGLQFGGAVGNLIDRVYQGYVTDFISVGNFPVFNIADACITVGVGVLILGMWMQERRQKQEAAAEAEAEEALARASTVSIETETPSQDSHTS